MKFGGHAITRMCLHVTGAYEVSIFDNYATQHQKSQYHLYPQSTVVTYFSCTTRPNIQNSAFCPHNVHLCVPCGSHHKQRLFDLDLGLSDHFPKQHYPIGRRYEGGPLCYFRLQGALQTGIQTAV
jgi:hypothetical protein